MAVLKYGKYSLFSRPRHHPTTHVWRPSASVLWYDDKDVVQSHRFNLNRTFETEKDALLFGFLVARMWIDGNEGRPRRRSNFRGLSSRNAG